MEVNRLTLMLSLALLSSMMKMGVHADEDSADDVISINPCNLGDITCDPETPLPTYPSYKQMPSPTERPKKNAPSDPNKYGLVPPFLIGASTVILVYIIGHCLYLHCYAKKKIQTLTEQSMTSTTQNQTTLIISDGPSTTSLAVRYDGAYGKTEIINATPYLLCQNNQLPTDVAISNSQSLAATASAAEKRGFLSKFQHRAGSDGSLRGGITDENIPARSSIGSGDSSSTLPFNRDGESTPVQAGPGGELCFVPLNRAMYDQNRARPEWTPLQGIMCNSNGAGGVNSTGYEGMKRDSSHTLVFVPVNSPQPMNDYNVLMSQIPNDVTNGKYLPLEGNASNMAVPMIVEDQASDAGSRGSSNLEHEALVHDDIRLSRVGEHSV